MRGGFLVLAVALATVAWAAESPPKTTLADLARAVSARLWVDSGRETALLRTETRSLSIDLRTGWTEGEGEPPQLQPLEDSATGRLLASADVKRLKDWFAAKPSGPREADAAVDLPARDSTSRRVQVIVLDAGHGGSDPGSLGRHTLDGKEVVLREKDLTLSVVLELDRLLGEALPDRNIVLTRKGDTYPTLEERVRVAHAQKLGPHDSILFLSVHFNASLNKNASGLEFWYVPQDYDRQVIAAKDVPESAFPVLNLMVDQEFKKESQELAGDLAKGLATELGDSQIQRGLKENPWFVVRMARMPAVLAELGFITNPDEAKDLVDPEYLKRLAHGLYTGLVSFIKTYEDLP